MLHTVTCIINSILIEAWERVNKTNPGATAILSEIGSEYHSLVECHVCGHSFVPTDEQLEAWANSGRNWDPTDWECPDCIKAETEREEYLDQADRVREDAYQAHLAELDNDPRFQDPFQRPGWNGDPNEY